MIAAHSKLNELSVGLCCPVMCKSEAGMNILEVDHTALASAGALHVASCTQGPQKKKV